MKMTFRWFGESDSIPLAYIRQIPGMDRRGHRRIRLPAGRKMVGEVGGAGSKKR